MRRSLIPLLALAGLAAVAQARPAAAMPHHPDANIVPVQWVGYGYGDDWRWRRHEAWREAEWRRHEAWREWRHERWAAEHRYYAPYY